MTNEEINKLEAGRELDMLVAKHVLGLTVRRGGMWDYEWLAHKGQPLVDMFGIKEGYFIFPNRSGWTYAWGVLHKYSTDISAAWEVAEIFLYANVSFDGVTWSASLNNDGVDFKGYSDINNPTAPLAICRASLKAVNVA